VQFEWEDEPQTRAVRLVSGSARVHDPVRVTVAHVDAEGAHRGSWVFEAASARASSSPVACFGRCRRWNPTVCPHPHRQYALVACLPGFEPARRQTFQSPTNV